MQANGSTGRRQTRIAIVGAGLTGLVLARALQSRGTVTVIEKARGVGGRMATRYAGRYEFDHGAQFFTARTKRFREFLRPLIDCGVVDTWRGTFAEFDRGERSAGRPWTDDHPHYVGSPRMNAIGKHLADGLDIRLDTRVTRLEHQARKWILQTDDGPSLGPFDWVIVTAPAAQTAALLPEPTAFRAELESIDMLGCYALMLGFPRSLELDWQAALVRQADISWISVNSSKPGRPPAQTLVVHSTNAWAQRNMETPPEQVKTHLLAELRDVTGLAVAASDFVELQRWRYANIGKQAGPKAFVDEELGLAAAGDWCVRGRVEAAFTSADALAQRLNGRSLFCTGVQGGGH